MADFTPGHITVTNFQTVEDEINSVFTDTSLEFVIDGGESAITTGVKGFLVVPYHGTISHITLLADTSGDIKIDIWRIRMEQINTLFPPTDANSITNGHEPEIVSGDHFVVSSTGFGNGNKLNKYDILAFNVDSCATITRVTIEISVNRSVSATRSSEED